MKQLQSYKTESMVILATSKTDTGYSASPKLFVRMMIGAKLKRGDCCVALFSSIISWYLALCFGISAPCNTISAQTVSVEIAVTPSSNPGKNTISVGYRPNDGSFIADDGTDEWNAQTITLGWMPGSGISVSAPATNANITNFSTPSSFSFVDNFFGSSDITSYSLSQLGGSNDGFIYTTFVVNGSTSNQPIAEGELLPVFTFDVPNSWPISNNSIFLLTEQPPGVPIGLSPVILNSVLGQVWDNQASGSILPLELLSFSAELQGQDGLLKWATIWEVDTDFFEIEHSNDGRSFRVLGQVGAAGNSQHQQNYQFLHRQLPIGQNFYRLRMVDLDGSWTHSPLVQLNRSDKEIRLEVYPNPTSDIIQLNGTLNGLEIHLYDSSGRRLGTYQDIQQLDLRHYPSGVYWLSVTSTPEQVLLTKKIIKQE